MSKLAQHLVGTPCWFDLMTSDRAGAVAFYGQLFGWQVTAGDPEYGHYGMCQLDGDNVAGLGPLPPGAAFPPAWTIYFASADAAHTARAITEAGGRLVVAPMEVPAAGVMVIATDPTGAVFGVWEPRGHVGATRVHEPGAMAWCEVNTRDAARAASFYATVFGLEARPMDNPHMVYQTLHKGEVAAAGVLQMTEAWGDLPPHWMPYFQVVDCDASAARGKELGGAVMHGPFDTPFGRMAVIRDPQGAVFMIMTRPEAA